MSVQIYSKATKAVVAAAYEIHIDGTRVGACQRVTPRQTRAITRVREIGWMAANYEGDVFTMVPGATDVSVEIEKVTLWASALADLCLDTSEFGGAAAGANVAFLGQQSKGFNILCYVRELSGQIRQRELVNCWLSDWSESIDIGGDLIVSETATAQCEYLN